MTLTQLNEAECLQTTCVDIGKAAILVTTPFCGTCKVAERMLVIAEKAGISYPLYKANINFTPRLRELWQIESVPCLVLLKNGKVVQKEYAMRSVDHLYRLLAT